MDNGNRIIATKNVSVGTVNEAPVYPREIAKLALSYDSSSVMLAHNHPGGSTRPSQADIQVTNNIVNSLDSLGIRVMDHIIVADDKFISFAETGLSLEPTNKIMEKAGMYEVAETNSFPDDLDSFTYDLMEGVCGKKHMTFEVVNNKDEVDRKQILNPIEVNANENCIDFLKGAAADKGRLVKLSSKGEPVCTIRLKDHELYKLLHHAYKDGAAIYFNSFIDSTKFSYYKEIHSVYLLEDKTIKAIMDINRNAGKHVTLKEIKDMYRQAGNKLEHSMPDSSSEFSNLSQIIYDVKRAKMEYRNINASLKAIEKQSVIGIEQSL